MLSNSGETDELTLLTPHLKRQGARLIAITGNEQSSLAQCGRRHLDAAVDAEACPLGLAPTRSHDRRCWRSAMRWRWRPRRARLLGRGFARAHPGGRARPASCLTARRGHHAHGRELPIVRARATLAEASSR
jgi:arabinose-5-phosphate isomerase